MGFFDDPANQPNDQQLVQQIAQNAGVAGSTNNIASDTATLAGKNPEDRQSYLDALTQQYTNAARNTPGGQESAQGGSNTGARGAQSGNFSGYASPDSIQPWTGTFTAPTAEQARATPGYQFDLSEGLKAVTSSRAASGALQGGGTLKALQSRGQGIADANYQNTFNNANTVYNSAKNDFLTNETNRFNSQRANLGDQYSMLSGDRNYGLAADNQQFNQGLAQQGQDFNIFNTTDQNYYNRLFSAANLGNPGAPNYAQYGANASDLITGGANANAAGIVGASNATNSGINSSIGDALALYFNSRKAPQ